MPKLKLGSNLRVRKGEYDELTDEFNSAFTAVALRPFVPVI